MSLWVKQLLTIERSDHKQHRHKRYGLLSFALKFCRYSANARAEPTTDLDPHTCLGSTTDPSDPLWDLESFQADVAKSALATPSQTNLRWSTPEAVRRRAKIETP